MSWDAATAQWRPDHASESAEAVANAEALMRTMRITIAACVLQCGARGVDVSVLDLSQLSLEAVSGPHTELLVTSLPNGAPGYRFMVRCGDADTHLPTFPTSGNISEPDTSHE